MKTISSIIVLVTCVSALSGCASNKPVDLGDDKTGTTAQGLADYEGAWDGYVEAYKFASGSDRLRITLDAEGQGTIEVGDAPAIPPFTDPNVGYPTTDPPSEDAYLDTHEGYGYPVGDAAVHDGRITFTAWTSDLQKAWCEAQTSYVDDNALWGTGHSCLGVGDWTEWTSQPDGTCVDVGGTALDCGFITMCRLVCTCDASGCTSGRMFEHTKLQVDGALETDGQTLAGTLVLPDARATIRLERH